MDGAERSERFGRIRGALSGHFVGVGVGLAEVETGACEVRAEPPQSDLGGGHQMREDSVNVPLGAQRLRRPLLGSQVFEVVGQSLSLGMNSGPNVQSR